MKDRSRPVLPLTRGPVETAMEVAAVAGVAWCIGIAALSWPTLPERIPHHFDLAGRPDAWGRRWVFLILPAVAIGVYVLLTVVARFPHRFNFPWPIKPENAERQYRIGRSLLAMLKVEVLFMLASIEWITVSTAGETSSGLGAWFLPVVLGASAVTVLAHLMAASKAR